MLSPGNFERGQCQLSYTKSFQNSLDALELYRGDIWNKPVQPYFHDILTSAIPTGVIIFHLGVFNLHHIYFLLSKTAYNFEG